MLTNPDFAFQLSVSEQNYQTKPTVFTDICFTNQSVTVDYAVQLATEGKAFCYNFPTDSRNGKITLHTKKKENFISTSTVFFDFDDMNVPMESYISSLDYKPTFSYSSYSDGNNGLHRYRLVYVMSEPIISELDYSRITKSIIDLNKFILEKKGICGGLDIRPVNQLYFGTKPEADTYKSYLIYSPIDFNYSLTNEIPFKNKVVEDVITSYSQMENDVIKDYWNMKTSEFIFKYEPEYDNIYISSLSSALSLSENQMYHTYPEDYQEVKRNWIVDSGKRYVAKVKDGMGRRRRLYITAQIMKHNIPGLKLECLLYCLLKERNTYYEIDESLNKERIMEIAKNALKHSMSLKPCKHPQFKINKDYWLRGNMTANAAKQIVRKMLKEEQVLEFYDFSKSVKENLEMLKQEGIKVGKSYLYELKKKYDFPFENKDKEDVYTSYS